MANNVIPSNAIATIDSVGVKSLPDNPSQSGYNAAAVKSAIQRTANVITHWLQELDESIGYDMLTPKVLSAVPTGDELAKYEDGSAILVLGNQELTAYVKDSGSFVQVGDGLAMTAHLIDLLQADVIDLQSYFTAGIAKKAFADEDGNNIKTTYATNALAVHLAGAETITGKKTFTEPPLFNCDITFGENKSVLLWYGFIRTTGDKFLEIGGDSVSKVSYKVPYYGHSYYGNTYTLATTSQVATAKSEAISDAATTAQSKVDALATAMDFSNGAFGTITASTLNVTTMNVTETKTMSASVEDQLIEMLAGNETAYGTNYVGKVYTKYDGTNDFFEGIYNDTLMIGDCTAIRDSDGKLTGGITPISLEPLMTRAADNALTDGHLLKWDSTNRRAIDAEVTDTQIASVLNQESDRVLAESGRVSAENARVLAETARALQEKYRVMNHPYPITQAEYTKLTGTGVFGVHLSTPLQEGDEPELVYTVYDTQALAEAANETYIFPMQSNIQYPAKGTGGDAPYLDIPAPPVSDGTYHLKLTVSSGVATYEWEADE